MANGTIYICCSCDKNFVMPLTVTLLSLFEHLDRSRRAAVYILDGGIRTSDRNRLLKSLKGRNADLRFIKISEHDLLKDMIVTGHISIATYYRILIPLLLPENIKKVIYLDADLVINADIGKLWNIETGEHHVLAVQEQSKDCLYVSSPLGLLNYKELGLDPTSKYFNAGMMVINIGKWRQDKISQKVVDYILENKKYIRCWDQDAFNAVLSGKWGELDHRWNLCSGIFLNPTWEEGPIKDKKRYGESVEHPYIIHFNSSDKPWKFGCSHPHVNLFMKYLNKTPWYWQYKLLMPSIHMAKLLRSRSRATIKRVVKKILGR